MPPARRSRSRSADVNDFRRVNDSLGTELGEELLTQVSARLRSAVRPGDLVAREGGEGFLVLVRDLPIDARYHAEAVGQRIADAMHAPFALGAAELLLDASVGISIFPDDAETPERCASTPTPRCTRRARSAAASTSTAPVPPTRSSAGARAAAAAGDRAQRARAALPADPAPGRRGLIGVESLVRWRDPMRGGLVPPGDFIPVAERTGVIDALGDWVLRESAARPREWAALGLRPNVGFNVSPRQLRRPDVGAAVRRGRQRARDRAGPVVLEITESAWSLEASRLLPVLGELRAAGFALAIDDFGAG